MEGASGTDAVTPRATTYTDRFTMPEPRQNGRDGANSMQLQATGAGRRHPGDGGVRPEMGSHHGPWVPEVGRFFLPEGGCA